MSGKALGMPLLLPASNWFANCALNANGKITSPRRRTAAGFAFQRPIGNCHWRAIRRGTSRRGYKERPRGRSRLRRWSASDQPDWAIVPCGSAFPGPRTGQPETPSFRASGPTNTDECDLYAVGCHKYVGGIVAVEIAFNITDNVVRAILAGNLQVITRILAGGCGIP